MYNHFNNTNNVNHPNLKSEDKNKKYLLLIIFILFLLTITALFLLIKIDQKNANHSTDSYIKSILVKGYNLDKQFDNEQYNYKLTVKEDNVYIGCDSKGEIKGCNEEIDLSNKDIYEHKIILNTKKQELVYTITIQKELIQSEVKIISIEGNPKEWINQDVEIKVNATADNSISGYSFDGGKSFKKQNSIIINENKIVNIVVKDSKGNLSDVSPINVEKIDNIKPTAKLLIESKTNESIKLKVNAIDNESGIDGVSFNNGKYTNNYYYTINKAGTYRVKIKDKAGNVSDEAVIVIKENDFLKNNTKNFVVNFNSNGAIVSEKQFTCPIKGESCEIILPKITRDEYEVLGWSLEKDGATSQHKAGDKVTINNDTTYYAITRKKLTTFFDKNVADSVEKKEQSCYLYNNNTSCYITAPNATRTDYKMIGWSTSSNSTSAQYKVGEQIKVTKEQKYYAITAKTITISFNLASARSCNIYNRETECSITMPVFNIVGSYNGAWGTQVIDPETKYWVGKSYSFSKDTTLYGSIRHPWGEYSATENKNYKKIRKLSVYDPITIGNKIIEYDTKIPQSTVDKHIQFFKTLYNDMPCLFVPGKVFILNHDTYSNYSQSLGVVHYYEAYSFADLQHEKKGTISLNATVHELAHTWDHYYGFKTGTKLSAQKDLKDFTASLGNLITIDNEREIFAAMVTNYYWHILGKNTNESYYALCKGCTLNDKQKNELKTIMEKYIKISNNGYK